jgi:dihydrofolate reductase
MKTSVFIAISFDGFIARSNGDLDWLPNAESGESSPENEDYGYNDFFNSVDVMVMGRKTFEKVLSFGSWPYQNKKVIILSKSLHSLPNDLPETVELKSSSPKELISDLDKAGYNHIYVDGGMTIQQFLKDGMIDELIITRIPVLIGEGIPLFGYLKNDIKLKHVDTTSFKNGLVQSTYQLVKKSSS